VSCTRVHKRKYLAIGPFDSSYRRSKTSSLHQSIPLHNDDRHVYARDMEHAHFVAYPILGHEFWRFHAKCGHLVSERSQQVHDLSDWIPLPAAAESQCDAMIRRVPWPVRGPTRNWFTSNLDLFLAMRHQKVEQPCRFCAEALGFLFRRAVGWRWARRRSKRKQRPGSRFYVELQARNLSFILI
jgi:hypothetical protein